MTGWKVHWTDEGGRLAHASTSSLWTRDELLSRERNAGIAQGTAFMTDPELAVDGALTAYFNTRKFKRLAESTRLSYTADYRVFFNFLWTRGKRWNEATEDDIEDFEEWRRRSPNNPQPIGGSKWMRELAALARLYEWATARGHVASNPIAMRRFVSRSGEVVERPEAAARDIRSSNVKWLTPAAFNQWRNVGLQGYLQSGLPDPTWRGRNDDRNAAYANLLFDSGMRRTEAASLFVLELPSEEPNAKFQWTGVKSAVTKSQRGRAVQMKTQTLRSIYTYIATSRAAAVRRAQATGRYEHIRDKRIYLGMSGNLGHKIRWRLEDGSERTLPFDRITIPERQKFFVQTPGGLEPLWLWLSETGMPFQSHSWENVFAAANRRVVMLVDRRPPYCTPHMARHSFALIMLITLDSAMDKRYGFTPQQRREFQQTFGDAYSLVKNLLGHRFVETTKAIYTTPVENLRARALMEGEQGDTTELLASLVLHSGLIQDVAK